MCERWGGWCVCVCVRGLGCCACVTCVWGGQTIILGHGSGTQERALGMDVERAEPGVLFVCVSHSVCSWSAACVREREERVEYYRVCCCGEAAAPQRGGYVRREYRFRVKLPFKCGKHRSFSRPRRRTEPPPALPDAWGRRLLTMDSHSAMQTIQPLDDAAFKQTLAHILKDGLGCKQTITVDVISDPN